MNILDLIICLVLLVALFNGWRKGFILQLCSLVAVVAAIVLASRYGAEAGAFLKLDAQYAEPAGFVVVLLVAMLVMFILLRPYLDDLKIDKTDGENETNNADKETNA